MRAPPTYRAYVPVALVALTPIALFWSHIPPASRTFLLIAALGIFAILFVIIRSSRRTRPLIEQRTREADAVRRDRYLLLDSLSKRSDEPSPPSPSTPTRPTRATQSSS